MKHLGTQTLETERLILRRFRLEDAQAMFDNWASDPVVTKYLTWPTHENAGLTAMVMKDWVEGYVSDAHYKWAITLKDGDDRPIGDISVVHFDERVDAAEIGYCMGKAWWGKGLMTEALRAVIGYLIGQVGMNRVCARHDARNIGSGRVMQKCGMRYEGTLRQVARNNVGICDICTRSILAEEWNK